MKNFFCLLLCVGFLAACNNSTERLDENGENSGVEFKRDDIRPEQLAKEVVALANVQGGRILLGVEDNGSISGLQRPDSLEWVLNVFRDKVHPQMIPFYEEILIEEDRRIGVITLPWEYQSRM